jgi:hypothetical protein
MTSSVSGSATFSQTVVGVNGRDEYDLPELVLGRKLGTGGQGEVWTVTNLPEVVFKRYLTGEPDLLALRAMLEFPRKNLKPSDHNFLLEHCAWPLARVKDGPEVIGFLMRMAPALYLANPNEPKKPQLRELQYLLYTPPIDGKWGDIQPLHADGRVSLCREFLRLVRLLHDQHVAIGDISMSNTLWSDVKPFPVFQLDCDSMTIEGKNPVKPIPDTPNWGDPSQPPGTASITSDRYKIALFVARVLTNSAYIEPGDGNDLKFVAGIDPRVEALVGSLFAEAGGDPPDRPDVRRWQLALDGRNETKLVPPPPLSARMPTLPDVPGRLPKGLIPLQPLRRA